MSFASRWRDVYVLSAARAVSVTGDLLAVTALALTIQSRGDSGWGVATLFAAGTLPLALLAPLGGRLADRVDSRVLLVTVSLLQAAVCTLLAHTEDSSTMVVLVALLASGVAVTGPTTSALVPDMVKPGDLSRAMAISQTASAVGTLAGPAFGAFLVAGYGSRLPLLVDAASFLAVAGAAAFLRTRRGGRITQPDGPAKASGWRLRDDRLIVTLLVAPPAVITVVVAVEVAEIFFVRETLRASEVMYGIVASVWTLGLLVGAWPFGRVRGSDRALVTVLLAAMAALCAILLASAAVPSAFWLVPLYLVGGMANAGINVLGGVVVARRVPPAVRGYVIGRLSGLVNTGMVVGYAVGGALLQVAVPRLVIAAAGLGGLAVSAVFLAPGLTPAGRQPERMQGTPVVQNLP